MRFCVDFLAELAEVGLQALSFLPEVVPLAVRELFPPGIIEATCTADAFLLLDDDFPW